jgi:polyhydroxybutyrate depolymerase
VQFARLLRKPAGGGKLAALVPALLLLACGSGGAVNGASGSGAGTTASTSGTSAATTTSGTSAPIGGDRPVVVHVPASYQPGTPVPLVMMLHGYSASALIEEAYLGITAESDKRGFIYAMPDGTVDQTGLRFWNATDACCDLYGTGVDDSTYLSSVISQIEARYTIDPKRAYLVGHSNGAFMSYRMACDHADQVTALVSLAGAMWEDVSKCTPSAPVSTLEIHGTADTTIAYDGGAISGHTYPSVPTTVSDWVTFDGCSATLDTTAPPLDLDAVLPGDETTVTRYGACAAGGHAELWTITGGAHIPTLSTAFTPDLIQFLYDHPRP